MNNCDVLGRDLLANITDLYIHIYMLFTYVTYLPNIYLCKLIVTRVAELSASYILVFIKSH